MRAGVVAVAALEARWEREELAAVAVLAGFRGLSDLATEDGVAIFAGISMMDGLRARAEPVAAGGVDFVVTAGTVADFAVFWGFALERDAGAVAVVAGFRLLAAG